MPQVEPITKAELVQLLLLVLVSHSGLLTQAEEAAVLMAELLEVLE